jgi:anti-sigma regulatory factor (Ser/Thr protein kinase)
MDEQVADLLGSLTLPGDVKSAGRARLFVEQMLDGRVDDMSAVALMTSELVTNVAVHAASQLTVTVRAGPPIRVEVHDGVAATEAFRDLVKAGGTMPDASASGGRGLHLLRLLSSRIGLDDDPDGGKVVWFEL